MREITILFLGAHHHDHYEHDDEHEHARRLLLQNGSAIGIDLIKVKYLGM